MKKPDILNNMIKASLAAFCCTISLAETAGGQCEAAFDLGQVNSVF
jgi:hypothetical protein